MAILGMGLVGVFSLVLGMAMMDGNTVLGLIAFALGVIMVLPLIITANRREYNA